MDSQLRAEPAVFLDRDGVLCKEKGYVTSQKELEIFDYTRSCIEKIKEKGYYTIVITNQSGVARGLFTEETLMEMNEYLKKEIDVDAVYYCPHHPQGKIEKYVKDCICRKPGIELLQRAVEHYNIDMEHSYMVGDRASDIQTGQNAGIKTILLESGYGTERLEVEVKPDYIRNDLRDIIDIL